MTLSHQVFQVCGWTDYALAGRHQPIHTAAFFPRHRAFPPAAGVQLCGVSLQPRQPRDGDAVRPAHARLQRLPPTAVQWGHALLHARHLRGNGKLLIYKCLHAFAYPFRTCAKIEHWNLNHQRFLAIQTSHIHLLSLYFSLRVPQPVQPWECRTFPLDVEPEQESEFLPSPSDERPCRTMRRVSGCRSSKSESEAGPSSPLPDDGAKQKLTNPPKPTHRWSLDSSTHPPPHRLSETHETATSKEENQHNEWKSLLFDIQTSVKSFTLFSELYGDIHRDLF